VRCEIRNFLTAVMICSALPCLKAGEVWDDSFKLSLGQASGAKDAGLGSNTSAALTIEGSYPLFAKGALVFDAGYRMQLKTSTRTSIQSGAFTQFDDSQTKGYFGSVLYRFTGFKGSLDGLYVHGGVRYSSLKASTDRTTMVGDVASASGNATDLTGPNVSTFSPIVGMGVRFTEKLSLDVNFFSQKGTSVDGLGRKSTVIELALGIHM
jgi:hypothetical protein